MLSVRSLVGAAFTPLARRMSTVDPNTLTVVSLTAGVAAGLAFALAGRGPGYYAAAGILVAVSGSADALDGLVARLHGRTSAAGDFLDHAGDRLVEVCLLVGIAASPGASAVFGLAVVILTLLNSYLGTQIEATFGRRAYTGLGKAEQFIGLVMFAAVLAIAPDLALSLGGLPFGAADALFALLGAGAVAGLVHRVRLGVSLAVAGTPHAGAPGGPDSPENRPT